MITSTLSEEEKQSIIRNFETIFKFLDVLKYEYTNEEKQIVMDFLLNKKDLKEMEKELYEQQLSNH